MTATLEPVLPHDARRLWPQVRGWVEAAASDTASWTADDWLGRVLNGHAQLWLIVIGSDVRGVFITEIYDTAVGKTCALPIVAGEKLGTGALCVLSTIEAWAKEQACTRLQGDGREGWVRALKALGWRPVSVQIEKRIS